MIHVTSTAALTDLASYAASILLALGTALWLASAYLRAREQINEAEKPKPYPRSAVRVLRDERTE